MTRGRGCTHEDIVERMEKRDAELDQRLASGEKRFSAIEEKLNDIITLLEPLPQMKTDIADTKDLVVAWSTMKNVGRFVKWAGPIIAAFVAIIVAIKAGAAAFVDWGHRP